MKLALLLICTFLIAFLILIDVIEDPLPYVGFILLYTALITKDK